MAERSLNFQKWQAAGLIDQAAGEARLRYITDLPGQQEIYLTKLEQARAFIKDSAVVPPYIAAEADARKITPAAAVTLIVNAAKTWHDVKGPAIEGARIKLKLAIQSAKDSAEIASIRDQGLSFLMAL